MNQPEVRRAEEAIESGIAEALRKEIIQTPLPPRILHLMAKAAVTVLEAALEAERRASSSECPD